MLVLVVCRVVSTTPSSIPVSTYTEGAATALLGDERLIFRACSRTLDFASSIEDPAAMFDLHRTNEGLKFCFCMLGTRIRAAGRAMFLDEEKSD